MSDDIRVLQDYHSAYNEIVQPDVIVYQSRYYVRRWKPLLGGNGDAIVMTLRSLGYYNRETGETRDGIPIDLPELARLCGLSVPTIKREFGSRQDGTPANPALHRFVQREKNYRRDKVTGQIWREENVYRVKMDDPIHDEDLPKLKAILEARQKGGAGEKGGGVNPKGGGKPAARKAHPEPYGNPRMAHPESETSQSESRSIQVESEKSQSESGSTQSEPALKNTLTPPEILSNSSPTPAAPGDSLSLFSEEEPAWRVAYNALPDGEREALRSRASALAPGRGIPRSNIPEICKLARELFREGFEAGGG